MIYLSYNTLPSHLPLFQLVSISQIRINDLKKKILKRNLKNTLALLVDPFPHSGNLAINKQPFSDFLHSNQYVRIILRKFIFTTLANLKSYIKSMSITITPTPHSIN